MKKVKKLKTRFSKYIPPMNEMKEGIMYVSKEYLTCSHICPCGCGRSVPIPFITRGSRKDTHRWSYYETKEGNDILVTLKPSLRSTVCGAHYFINDGQFILCSDHRNFLEEHKKTKIGF